MSGSHYVLECERCHTKLTPALNFGKCPKCGVLFEIEWPAKHHHKPPEPTISEECER